MAVLFIGAQDIRSISFALTQEGRVTQTTDVQSYPEAYLAALARTLEAWKVSLQDVAAVAVVVGPGAFTASRVSTMIANTISFARGIPVYPIENPKHLPLLELADAFVPRPPSAPFALPIYDRAPNITQQKPA